SVVHRVPRRREAPRILSDERGPEVVADRGDHGTTAARAADNGLGLTPTDQAIGHLDAHDRGVEAGDPAEVGHVLLSDRDRTTQPDGRYVADQHRGIRSATGQISGSSVVAHFST